MYFARTLSRFTFRTGFNAVRTAAKTYILLRPCHDLRFVPASTRFEPLRKLVFRLYFVMICDSRRLQRCSNRFENLHFAWALARFTIRPGLNAVRSGSKPCMSLGPCRDLRFAPASTRVERVRQLVFRLDLVTNYASYRLQRGWNGFENLHVAWTVSRIAFPQEVT